MKRLISLLSILFLLLSPALADELTDTARASLTEVMSYTAEEAARFVFEPQPDGSLHYWLPEHPDWVYTMELLSNGAVRCASPFDTRCVYQTGEGILRELLRAIDQKDWMENWNENARRELLALCQAMGVTRQSTALRFAETAAQAVDGLLESCCGPQVRWTKALIGLRDSVLASHGLTAAEQPFHTPGVRRYTGPDRGSAAEITLILFEGEAPEELREALADPHLDGWTLTSGAVRINAWKDRSDSGAGLAAFEREGRRQLIQLALLKEGWKAYPLGEKALRQTGDYRVTYNDPGGYTVEYPLNEEETLSFYLVPKAWEQEDFTQVYCQIDAGHRVNRRTGESQWLGVDGSGFPIWQDEWTLPYARCTTVRFLPFLGQQDIAAFPESLEAGQAPCLPENTGMTLGQVNFRSKTSSRSKAYGQLLAGVTLPVTEILPGDPNPWVHTRLGFYDGYISEGYVDLGEEELNAIAPQPVAMAKEEIPLKRGTGWLDGTVQTLPAGTRMHAIMEDGDWLYVSVPRGEMDWLMDAEGTFGFVKKADVFLASLPCQLDWME